MIFNSMVFKTLKRLFPFFLRYKGRILIASISMFVVIMLQLPLPLLTMYVIDHLISSDKTDILTIVCFGLIAILLIRTISSFLENYYLNKFRLRLVYDLKQLLYEQLLKMPLDYFHKKQTGYLISRVSGDVEGVQGLFVDTFLNILRNILTFIVGLTMIYWLNVKLAVIATLLMPFYFITLVIFNKKIRLLMHENREAYANLFRFLQEHISGIQAIKAFVIERYDTIEMLKSLKVAIRKEFKSGMFGNITALSAGFISSLSPIFLLWIGIIEIIEGRFTLGGLMAFNSFLVYVFSPLNSFSNINVSIQNSVVCADRLFQFLDESEISSQAYKKLGKYKHVQKGEIQFNKVNFSYNDNDLVLKNVSFKIPSDSVTAIVGRSGMGKSSLVNLLFRFYQINDGEILIDGNNIIDYNIRSLRKNIGLVSQDTFLFGHSIYNNIKIGNMRATKEEIVNASKAAFAHDFIMNLPEQYETKIGERGALISGGERQRIALARVFLKNPKIVILDEATSSLDSYSENIIKKALDRLFLDRTVIVISHRLTAVDSSDQIIYIDDGQIVETGNHLYLYQNNSSYKKLYDEQFHFHDKKVG